MPSQRYGQHTVVASLVWSAVSRPSAINSCINIVWKLQQRGLAHVFLASIVSEL